MRFQTEYMKKYSTSPDKFKTQNIEYRNRKDYSDEPAFQKKKRVPSHIRESIQISDGHTLKNEQFKQYEERKRIDSMEKNIFNYRQQQYSEMKAENERKHANDEFIVLGKQDKLASDNVAYALRKPTTIVETQQQQQPTQSVQQANDLETTLKQVENEKVKHANDYDYVILGPNNTNQNSAVIYKLKNKVHNRRQPHKIIKSPTKLNTNKIRKSVKLQQQQQQPALVTTTLVHSCGSQTDLKPAPAVNVDTGAVKITKESVPIRIVPMTEYQKSFMWKENAANKVDPPVVTASVDNVQQSAPQQPAPAPQVVLNNQRPSTAIQSAVAASNDFDLKSKTFVAAKKRDPIHRTSEYKSNFVTYSKPKSQTTKKEEVVIEHYDSDSEEAKRKVLYISNPSKPFGPHGNLRRWKSEYQTSFKAYSKFDEDKLKAEAAAKAVEQANRQSEWFKNIVELRRKAEEYKIRSYGVNFSSDHLGQLVGRNLELWDVESKSSSDKDEREKQQKIAEFVQKNVVQSPKRKPKTRSRSVEAPVIVEAYERVENKKNKQIESNSQQQQQVQVQQQAPQYGVLNKNEPIVRLINNLSSTQIKNTMQWDSQSDYSDYELRLRNELNTKNSKQLIENHAALLDRAKKRLDEERRSIETSSDSQQQQQQQQQEPLQEFSHDHHYHHHHQQIQVNQDVPSHRICSVCARRPKTIAVDTKPQQHHHQKSKITNQKLHQIEDYLASSNNGNCEAGYTIVPTKYKQQQQQQQTVVKEAFTNNANENDEENFQFKKSLNLHKHEHARGHHEPLKSINENFGQTYIKPRKDVDTDSLSQLSTRSLASSSSLLERAKGNRDKFWGKNN